LGPNTVEVSINIDADTVLWFFKSERFGLSTCALQSEVRALRRLMSVHVSETFESTAILADNFCTGVQDAR